MELRPDAEIGRALAWTAATLALHGVPYQVVGGLAARAYGARRPIADIDLYAPLDRAGDLLCEVAEHVRPGPGRYPHRHRSAHWDLVYVELDCEGVTVEIGDTSTCPRFLDAASGDMVPQDVDLDAGVALPVLGVTVPVMPVGQLLDYKRRLARPVDLADVAEITAALGG